MQGEKLSDQEKQKVWDDVLTNFSPLIGVARDQAMFHLKASKIEQQELFVKLIEPIPRVLLASEELALMFTLSTGQYLLRAKMALRAANLYALRMTVDVLRMQRRANFRALVNKSLPVHFKTESATYAVIDISAGGVALELAEAPVSEVLAGQLLARGEDPIDLRLKVKHVFARSANGKVKVGFEFHEPSPKQQQILFNLAIKIERQAMAHFLK